MADDANDPAGAGGDEFSDGADLDDDVVEAELVDDAGDETDERDDPDDPARVLAAEIDEAGDAALAEAAETVEADLVTIAEERDQFLDAYRRTQADFENFRKLSQKRQTDEVSRTLGAFVERLLPVLDACDAAIAHGADGASEVFNTLLGALEKEGLQRVDLVGEPFDPNVAEAVMHEPGEGGEQVVAEVLRSGYLWKEKVLRPAMVKVKD